MITMLLLKHYGNAQGLWISKLHQTTLKESPDMKKIVYMFREMFHLISKHKIAFMAPIIIILILIAILVYSVGPVAITTFIYAGV